MIQYLRDKIRAIVKDNRTRSILKAISYRVGSLVVTFLISLVVTHNLKFAFTIGGFDVLFKMFFYYLHERVWHHSSIGRR